jgi:hypothetical protein
LLEANVARNQYQNIIASVDARSAAEPENGDAVSLGLETLGNLPSHRGRGRQAIRAKAAINVKLENRRPPRRHARPPARRFP